MLSFFTGSRGPHGPDLPSPFRRKFQISLHTLPDDGRSISRNVAEKHHDSRHDKLRNNMNTKEYNMMLKVFDVVGTISDKYKPKGRKSFLNYPFVLKQILIMRNMDQYAKYIPQLKTHSKQKELERVWELITKDPEWSVALRKQKIV